jgi:hypothetical protein
VIGEIAKKVHDRVMGRLRILAALLSCLAVFAAGLPVVAFASVPAADAARAQTVAEPCQHCPDCSGAPCAPAAMACMIGCLAPLPTLGVATFTLPAAATSKAIWPSRLAALRGLSPPPDPFPPRS